MEGVANTCFEPLREWWGKALGVSSFFRCEHLNVAIGSNKTSQHIKGEAIDIDADIYNNGISNRTIFDWLKDNVSFDQLIMEYPDKKGEPRWVHISWKLHGGNRKEILIARRVNGRTTYEHYSR